MDPIESNDEAVATARKSIRRLTEMFPHHLSVKEEHLPKKLKKLSGSIGEKLVLLYKVTDQMFSEVAPYTPCKKGCASCCHIPVQIAQEEAEYIQDRTATPITSTMPAQDFLGIPCPFLVNEACSIYEHRPYACRRHTVVFSTAYWCAVVRAVDAEKDWVRYPVIAITPHLWELMEEAGNADPGAHRDHKHIATIPITTKKNERIDLRFLDYLRIVGDAEANYPSILSTHKARVEFALTNAPACARDKYHWLIGYHNKFIDELGGPLSDLKINLPQPSATD